MAVAPPVRPEALPSLLIMTGPNAGRKLVMNRVSLLFGSHPACDVKISGEGVADMHCLLVRTDAGLLLRDCKSPAGTLLNGMAIGESPLRDQDTFQIGTFQFRASLPKPTSVEAPMNSAQPTSAASAPANGAVPSMERLKRSRERLAKLAWRRRTQALVSSRRLAELERRLQILEAKDGPDQALELQAMEKRLDSLRRDLERREMQLKDAEHDLAVKMTEVQRERERYSAASRNAAPVELANARKELDRIKQHIKKLSDEEAKLLENMSTFRKIEAEERAKLEQVQALLARQQARLTPEDLALEAHADYYRQQVVYLQHEIAVRQQELAQCQARIDERNQTLRDLEEELNKTRAERERENEAWEAERAVQLEAFNRQRAEAKDLAEEKKQFLAERAKQLEELALKQAELDKKIASVKEMEEGIARQRKAIQEETETWIEQRQAYLAEMAERQEEIETIRVHLRELKAEEHKLVLSNAEWVEHAERERQRLQQELAQIRADAVKQGQAEIEATLKLLREKRTELEEAMRQFRHQAEQHWENFLSALRLEANQLLEEMEPPK